MSTQTILPASEYKIWTDNWAKQEATTGPMPFFVQDGNVQTGVRFHFESLRYLFSATGVVTIKVRFGLCEFTDGSPSQFHLILFGVNSQDTIITPYFISSAFTHHHHLPNLQQGEGNLPQALMWMWRESWQENVQADLVSKQMFVLNRVNGGFLRGYNYALKEFMDAVGTFTGAADIHFKFGLHKYYSLQQTPDSELAFYHTFGLIVYASLDESSDTANGTGAQSGGVIEDSGYYDFSAPCPYTC